MKRYLLVEVGCLECGEPCRVRGWTNTPPLDAIIISGEDADDYGYLVAIDMQSVPDA